jgi:tetratricopeptide (TPR) repeat protein
MTILDTLLCFALLTGPHASQSAAARPAPPPAGWDAVVERDTTLGLDGKHRERITILEGWVKRFPDFADAHMRLGGAYESVGRELISSATKPDPAGGLAYFDRAIASFRRNLDLGGGTMPDVTIRALADLLSLLRRSDERAAFVREVVTRFPHEPRAHVELARWHLESGRAAEAHAALTAGRKALPRDADAYSALAEGIWPDIAALPDGPEQARLSTLAGAIVNDALKLDPKHTYGLMLKEDVRRDQARRAKER